MLKNWFLASRPKTLVACFIPILSASALAYHEYPEMFLWNISILAFLSTMCIQIGTNLVNDAIDFHKGADTKERLGPMRVSQSGRIPPATVLKAGLLFFGLAIFAGIPLVYVGGWPIVLIGILSVVLGYCYTGGPYPIAYKGLGEVFVFLFFGFTAVCGTYYLQTGHVNLSSLVLGFQIGALSSVILAVNNYRDFLTDKKVNKLTLAARFGKKFARYAIFGLYLATYLLSIFWYFEYGLIVSIFSILTLPIAYHIVRGIFKIEPSKEINQYLGKAALVELLFGVMMFLGFIFYA